MQTFSTTGLQGEICIRAWNEFHEAAFPGLRISGKDDDFFGRVQSIVIGDLKITRPQSAASVVQRHLNNSLYNGGGHLVFHLMQSGECQLSHRNRTADVRAGDIGMCLSEEHYELDIPTRHDCLIVEMSSERMERKVQNIRDLAGVRLGREVPSIRMLSTFVSNLWDEIERGMTEELAAPYCDVIVDIMAQAIREQGEVSAPTDRGLFDQMTAAVLSRYADDHLTPNDIAIELGVSLRTLQMVAARHGTTPSRLLNEQRMITAARTLKTRLDLSITTISYQVGFNDSAYFSRRFQEFFGVNPSHYRKMH